MGRHFRFQRPPSRYARVSTRLRRPHRSGLAACCSRDQQAMVSDSVEYFPPMGGGIRRLPYVPRDVRHVCGGPWPCAAPDEHVSSAWPQSRTSAALEGGGPDLAGSIVAMVLLLLVTILLLVHVLHMCWQPKGQVSSARAPDTNMCTAVPLSAKMPGSPASQRTRQKAKSLGPHGQAC